MRATMLVLLAFVVVALVLWIAARAITSMPGRSHSGPLAPLTAAERDLAARLRAHVAAIASEEHNVAHPAALERSARYIEDALAKLGYAVAR